MDESRYINNLASIGVPFSTSDEIDASILPEKALCLASPLFYSSYKACSLTYTMLKHNRDLFLDGELAKEITLIQDKLALAMLCGILIKVDPIYFNDSLQVSLSQSREADFSGLDRSLYALAEYGRVPVDQVFLKVFGIKICEIEECERKKTTPRKYMASKNIHFRNRMNR